MDRNAKQKAAGLFTKADEIDISEASIGPELSKVWFDEETGKIAVSVDRLLFDDLTEVTSRYLEPNGYTLNLENMLAVIDSMRLGVFAMTGSKSKDSGQAVAKKLIPALCMQLPKKGDVGKVLRGFYEEVGRYEAELGRLQDAEMRARQSADASIKDDGAKKIIENLRVENLALRGELERFQKKLSSLEVALRNISPAVEGDEMPAGAKTCVVRSVRVQEGVVLLKGSDSQFTFPLKSLEGTPQIGSRAIAFFDGGSARAVHVYDPPPKPFEYHVAQVMSCDGHKIKIKFPTRKEVIISLAAGQPSPSRESQILCRFSEGHLISLTAIAQDLGPRIVDLIFEEQTRNQLKQVLDLEAA